METRRNKIGRPRKNGIYIGQKEILSFLKTEKKKNRKNNKSKEVAKNLSPKAYWEEEVFIDPYGYVWNYKSQCIGKREERR